MRTYNFPAPIPNNKDRVWLSSNQPQLGDPGKLGFQLITIVGGKRDAKVKRNGRTETCATGPLALTQGLHPTNYLFGWNDSVSDSGK